jgi:circadian clock protein KaiC
MSIEFLVRGAEEFGEPGVFLAFEETGEELAQNVRSLGFDLNSLCEQGKLAVDYVQVERSEIEEAGSYDLEGLFIRLDLAIRSVGAKRVVLDTLETLFGGLDNQATLRAEIRRLFRWLKDRGMTTIITGERGDGDLTRQGLEEYVSDCVILLDHRVNDALSTRRLRIIKYRGTTHGTNEYPFLIDASGISVLPITSLRLTHPASEERVSSGIAGLDEMLGGKGYYRGSSILVSGTSGTGKTSIAALFVDAACRRGERALYFSFEESEQQVVRNMRSIGTDLAPWIRKGVLTYHGTRPSLYGLEAHLVAIHRLVQEVRPQVLVIDPITAFLTSGAGSDVRGMAQRLVDFLKTEGITAMLTSLTSGGSPLEMSQAEISSIIDTWLMVRDVELGGERNRGLFVIKSRGMSHSNQIREFVLTDRGVNLIEVYSGPEGVLTGSLRQAQEVRERGEEAGRRDQVARVERELARRRRGIEAQIQALRDEFAELEEEARRVGVEEARRVTTVAEERQSMAARRGRNSNSQRPVRLGSTNGRTR